MTALSLAPTAWDIRYSKAMAAHPKSAPGGFAFTFPSPPGEIDYLTTRFRGRASSLVRIVFKVETISGAPKFQGHNDAGGYCDGATCRVMLQRRNDDLTKEHFRWWSRKGYDLAPGSAVLETSLADLTMWTNVFGHSAADYPAKFAACLADLANVGITHGGCGNYGHGCNTVNGTAKMTVTEFTIS